MLFRKYEIDIFNYYIFKNVISILEVGSLFSFLPLDNSLLFIHYDMQCIYCISKRC